MLRPPPIRPAAVVFLGFDDDPVSRGEWEETVAGHEQARYSFYSITCSLSILPDRVETSRTGFLMRKQRRTFPLEDLADVSLDRGSLVLVTIAGERWSLPIGRKAAEAQDAVRSALTQRETG
jgi:hypothetical protein